MIKQEAFLKIKRVVRPLQVKFWLRTVSWQNFHFPLTQTKEGFTANSLNKCNDFFIGSYQKNPLF